jgi:hypothetical protein
VHRAAARDDVNEYAQKRENEDEEQPACLAHSTQVMAPEDVPYHSEEDHQPKEE